MDEEELKEEIERKLDILRQRARAYEDFVNPPGLPPLFWQMVMLARLGTTVLPRVDHPDQDKSFPEMDVCMSELQWGSETRCFVGGDKFEVMDVPDSYHGIYQRYKFSVRPYWYMPPEEALKPVLPETEIYHEERLYVGYNFRDTVGFNRTKVRWMGRFMVLVGSKADERFKEWGRA